MCFYSIDLLYFYIKIKCFNIDYEVRIRTDCKMIYFIIYLFDVDKLFNK